VAEEVSPEEEQRRVLPVVEAMVKAGALVSIDTTHASTAAAALKAGAAIINDVSGLTMEPEMAELAARTGAPYVLTHRRGDAKTMNALTEYGNVAEEVAAELVGVRDKLYAAGVAPEQIIVDPGLGFAKNDEQNWELLRNMGPLEALGHRILVGASRKRFLGVLLAVAGKTAAPEERDHATAAITAVSAARGAWAVRVHDVGPSLDAVKVAARMAPRPLGNTGTTN
jgi:dihydropteroate synthase